MRTSFSGAGGPRKRPRRDSADAAAHGEFSARGNWEEAATRGLSPAEASLPDARLALLPPAVLAGARDALDIGCGSGALAISLGERRDLAPELRCVLGVDADPTLVARARELLAFRRREAALPPPSAALPLSVRLQLAAAGASLPPPAPPLESAAAAAAMAAWPDVLFRAEDFLAQVPGREGSAPPLHSHRAASFDVVFCMRTTKFVHLRGGDAALLLLFRLVHRVLRPGGRFVLQANTWRSYCGGKAMRMGVAPAVLRALRLRPAGFERHLLDTVRFASAERLLGGITVFVK
jgi:7SK snRNA methylphosphate capping enzyme